MDGICNSCLNYKDTYCVYRSWWWKHDITTSVLGERVIDCLLYQRREKIMETAKGLTFSEIIDTGFKGYVTTPCWKCKEIVAYPEARVTYATEKYLYEVTQNAFEENNALKEKNQKLLKEIKTLKLFIDKFMGSM